MNGEEQAQWVKLFSEFLDNDYVTVKTMGDGWKQAFERGLKVLEQMTMCQEFVEKSREYMDYERRVGRMGYFIEELRKQVVEVDGSLLASAVSAPQKRRRGRPTLAEAAEMKREQMVKESGKVEALAKVAGMKVDVVAVGKQQEANERKNEGMMGDLFGESGDEGGLHGTTTDGTGNDDGMNGSHGNDGNYEDEGEKAGRLQDVKGLLSGELQEAVDRVAMLRGEAARMSENAKEAAMAGKSADEVAVMSQKAAKLTEEYEGIFKAVDEDLAKKYIRARMSKDEVFEGEKRSDVLEKTLFYYKKVVKHDPSFEGRYIAKVATQSQQTGQNEKERKKVLKKVRDYFLRKDMKPSEARLEKMREKIEMLKKMGESVEEYEKILESERVTVKG